MALSCCHAEPSARFNTSEIIAFVLKLFCVYENVSDCVLVVFGLCVKKATGHTVSLASRRRS